MRYMLNWTEFRVNYLTMKTIKSAFELNICLQIVGLEILSFYVVNLYCKIPSLEHIGQKVYLLHSMTSRVKKKTNIDIIKMSGCWVCIVMLITSTVKKNGSKRNWTKKRIFVILLIMHLILFFYLQLSDFKCSCYKAIELLFIILWKNCQIYFGA